MQTLLSQYLYFFMDRAYARRQGITITLKPDILIVDGKGVIIELEDTRYNMKVGGRQIDLKASTSVRVDESFLEKKGEYVERIARHDVDYSFRTLDSMLENQAKIERERILKATKAKGPYKYLNAQGAFYGTDLEIEWGRHRPKTKDMVEFFDELGYMFLAAEGKRIDRDPKWKGYDVICLTKSRYKDRTRTLWAIKPLENINPLVEHE